MNKGKKEVIKAVIDLSNKCDLLLFGDYHTSSKVKEFFTSLLPNLRKRFELLFIEANTDEEKWLNNYLSGKVSYDELERFFLEKRNREHKGNYFVKDGIKELIITAKKLGFKIICVDLAEDKKNRDKVMYDNIKSGLKNYKRRGVFFGGNLHTLQAGNRAGRLLKKDFKIYSIITEFREATGDKKQDLNVYFKKLNNLKKIDDFYLFNKEDLKGMEEQIRLSGFKNEVFKYHEAVDAVILMPYSPYN